MSRQSFAITHKIEEVDAVLRAGTADLRNRVIEVHPEVSFCLWNDGRPMKVAKKRSAGREERRRLIEGAWPGVLERLERELVATGYRFARDDLYDAVAALWTARRVRAGTARSLPDDPPSDSCGLRMAIVG